MKLHVGVRALRRRRDELRRSADLVDGHGVPNDAATVGMLLFYAAECGLKERLLRRLNLKDTSGLEDIFRNNDQHDLRVLAKELRLPPTLSSRLNRLQGCKRHTPASGIVTVAKLHQAWRYGAKLDTADEKKAQEALRALIQWCEKDC